MIMTHGPKKSVTVPLPLELYETLSVLAAENSRSLSSYIRQILKLHVRLLKEHPNDADDWRHIL